MHSQSRQRRVRVVAALGTRRRRARRLGRLRPPGTRHPLLGQRRDASGRTTAARRRGARRAGAPAPVQVPGSTGTLPNFADLAEQLRPAVVNISTTATGEVGGARAGADAAWVRWTSGRSRRPRRPRRTRRAGRRTGRAVSRVLGAVRALLRPMPRQQKQRSLGSGFIIDRDGLILTNNHVVENADEIVVQTATDKEYKAKVVGRDPKTDLAVIKIDADGDEARRRCTLGDSDELRVGDWVIAIGNPVRPRAHGHRRHRQRQGPLHRPGQLRRLHPDRRRHQPGQLRRPAGQPERRGGRHQLRHLQPLRRQHRHRLRDPDQPRQGAAPAAAGEGQGHARLARRLHPEGDARDRRVAQARARRTARWSPTSWTIRRRPRPASRSAT